MFREVLFTTIVASFFIFFCSNCSSESTELTEDELEWYAKKRLRELRDTMRIQSTKDCNDNYQQYVQQKVDSLIIEHLKTADTSSLSKTIE